MGGFGPGGHSRRHDVGSSIDHKGDIYNALVGAMWPLTALNVVVDKKAMDDAIQAAIVGMSWQEAIIRFEAMVTNEPALPSAGDRYISTESGTIPSTSQSVTANDICEWNGGTLEWDIVTPADGWATIEQGVDPNIMWWYTSAAWRKLGTIVDHANLLNLDIENSGHTFPNKSLTLHVSANGSDVTGDGTILMPFATVQFALNYGVAQAYTSILILLDTTAPLSETVTIGDGLDVSVSSFEGVFNSISDLTFIVGNSTLHLDNIYSPLIKESAPGKTPDLILEDSLIDDITSSTGGNPTGTSVVMSSSWTSNALLDLRLNAAAFADGFYHTTSGITRMIGTNKILEVQGGRISGLAANRIASGSDAICLEYLQDRWAANDINLAGVAPVDADMAGYTAGCKAVGIGTGGRVFLMTNRGTPASPIVKSVEMS